MDVYRYLKSEGETALLLYCPHTQELINLFCIICFADIHAFQLGSYISLPNKKRSIKVQHLFQKYFLITFFHNDEKMNYNVDQLQHKLEIKSKMAVLGIDALGIMLLS